MSEKTEKTSLDKILKFADNHPFIVQGMIGTICTTIVSIVQAICYNSYKDEE